MNRKIGIDFIEMEKAPTATIFLMYCAFKINLKSKKSMNAISDVQAGRRIEGVSYIYDLNDFLNDPEIKLIVISTPLSSHYEYAKKVLEAGKNCLVEKPFTETTAEAIQLFKLAEEKDLRLEACQNRRFDSDFLTAVKMTESGKPGEVFEIESTTITTARKYQKILKNSLVLLPSYMLIATASIRSSAILTNRKRFTVICAS